MNIMDLVERIWVHHKKVTCDLELFEKLLCSHMKLVYHIKHPASKKKGVLIPGELESKRKVLQEIFHKVMFDKDLDMLFHPKAYGILPPVLTEEQKKERRKATEKMCGKRIARRIDKLERLEEECKSLKNKLKKRT